jgi:hypothetical protein
MYRVVFVVVDLDVGDLKDVAPEDVIIGREVWATKLANGICLIVLQRGVSEA